MNKYEVEGKMSWYPKGIDPRKGGIYRITNTVTDNVYIGSSSNLRRRLSDHKSRLKSNIHGNQHLQNSWNKHGINCFKVDILEFVEDVNKLANREQIYLDKYANAKKYNIRKYAFVQDEDLRKILSDNGNAKPVCQFDMKGSFIAEYESITIASKLTGIYEPAISGTCSGLRRSAGEYLWQFKEDYENGVELYIRPPICKAVCQINAETGEIIKSFDGIREASRETGVPRSGIANVAKGKAILAGGYKWMFLDDWERGIKISKKNETLSPVCQFDPVTKKLIRKYDSIQDAVKETNIKACNISAAKTGLTMTAGGFIWQSLEDYENGKPLPKLTTANKAVYQIDPVTKEILNEFESTKDAENFIGGGVYSALSRNGVSRGFIWMRVKDYENGKPLPDTDAPSKLHKPVYQCDPVTKEVITKYNSINEAALAIDRSAGSISTAIKNPNRTAGGYSWKLAPKD